MRGAVGEQVDYLRWASKRNAWGIKASNSCTKLFLVQLYCSLVQVLRALRLRNLLLLAAASLARWCSMQRR